MVQKKFLGRSSYIVSVMFSGQFASGQICGQNNIFQESLIHFCSLLYKIAK